MKIILLNIITFEFNNLPTVSFQWSVCEHFFLSEGHDNFEWLYYIYIEYLEFI